MLSSMRGPVRTSIKAWLAGVTLATGCAEPESSVAWPDEVWAVSAPEAQGIDSRALAEVLAQITARDLAVHELFIARHGVQVLDVSRFPYDGAAPHDVASVTKSLTSLGIGLAIDEGAIGGVDAGLVSTVGRETDGDPRRDEITIEAALTMTAGLQCISEPVELTLLQMQESADYVDFALSLPIEAEPGTVFNYCGSVSHLLSAAVGTSTGMPLDSWLRRRLWDPLGVDDVPWPRDSQGVTHGWGDARLYARDLARVGLLLTRDGAWRDEAVLTPEWIAASLLPHADSGEDPAYGYHWWVSEDGTYSARGRGGQLLYVVPQLDLVVVALGSSAPADLAAYAEVVDEVLLPGVAPEDSIPENPDAVADLEAATRAAAAAPAVTAPGPAPAIAAELDGRTFEVGDNPLGWQRWSWSFEGSIAHLSVTTARGTSVVDVGLDGVPRINHGVTFADLARHVDGSIALHGEWSDPTTFVLHFDSIAAIDAGTITFAFDPDAAAAEITLFERTFLGTEVRFAATQ
jgi:CubicO group peptidase (beta-lactamase class C family)